MEHSRIIDRSNFLSLGNGLVIRFYGYSHNNSDSSSSFVAIDLGPNLDLPNYT